MSLTEQEFLQEAYRLFNNRDADGALRLMHEAVEWPNGWEGGYVYGRQAVKEYWLRQWQEVKPHVEPLAFRTTSEGGIAVDVRLQATDMQHKLLMDATLIHTYFFTDGLIKRMEITEPETAKEQA